MGASNTRDPNIEFARVLGFCGVVFLHANSVGMFGGTPVAGFTASEVSRFAVPIFFMISGFLIKNISEISVSGYSLRLARKLLLPYAAWVLAYLLMDLSGLFGKTTFNLSIKGILYMIFAGDPGFHLWFLPGLWLGTTISLILMSALGHTRALMCAGILFLIGSIIGLYALPLGVHPGPIFYRNGLLFAPVFILIGYHFNPHALKPTLWGLLAAMGLIGQFTEGYLFGAFPNGHDMSASTIVYSVGLFGLVLSVRSPLIQRAGASGSAVFGAYLIHLLILKLLFVNLFSGSLLSAIACICLTIAGSLALSRVASLTPMLSWAVTTRRA